MMGRIWKPISLLLILALSWGSTVSAQGSVQVNIEHIENGQFPLLEIYLSVSNAQGFPIKNLGKSNFSVSEDNRPITDFEITPIQNTQQPLAVALVLDTSGSMASGASPTPLQNSIDAANIFVESLSQQDQVAVIGFANEPYIVQDFTSDKNQVTNSLNSLAADGNTTLYDGIVQAVGLLKNRSERRILVLITDGVDSNIGNFDFETSIDEATRWSVPIYPIGFGNVDRNELEQIAILTGGLAQIQPNSSDVQSAFSVILQVLREQYLLRYTSKIPADGANHNLQISVDNQSASQQFVALPGEVTITLPFQDGEVKGGNILLKPEVLAPAPLAELEILLDGSQLQRLLSEPFEYVWDSTTLEESYGQHEFTFIVKDKAGNTAQNSIVLNIQPPITVDIISPAEGDELNGSTNVRADIVLLAGIANIEFFIDNNKIETITAEPYEITVNWDDYPKGLHTLKVRATDINGFSDEKEVVIQTTGTKDFWFLILVIGLGLAALGIPMGLRRRRKTAGTTSTATTSNRGEAILRAIKGSNLEESWRLGSEVIKIGRKRGNNIQLKSSKASREHAEIKFENGQYVLHNLRDENPPLVNGMPVLNRQTLKSGDEIQFGEDILRYEQQ